MPRRREKPEAKDESSWRSLRTASLHLVSLPTQQTHLQLRLTFSSRRAGLERERARKTVSQSVSRGRQRARAEEEAAAEEEERERKPTRRHLTSPFYRFCLSTRPASKQPVAALPSAVSSGERESCSFDAFPSLARRRNRLTRPTNAPRAKETSCTKETRKQFAERSQSARNSHEKDRRNRARCSARRKPRMRRRGRLLRLLQEQQRLQLR